MKSDISPIKVTHYGAVHFGADVECEALRSYLAARGEIISERERR